MKIKEIYEKYRIPPNLAEHQIEVASVSAVICDLIGHEGHDDVIKACLLHDMGNIIKFKYDREIPGLKVENVEYWKQVQKEFIEEYGNDEHDATIKIVDEIGASSNVLDLVNSVGFRNSIETLDSGDKSKMIAAYSDMRVSPLGVTDLESRLNDLTVRYGASPDREQFNLAFRKIEELLFSDTTYNPSDVTKELVSNKKDTVSEYTI